MNELSMYREPTMTIQEVAETLGYEQDTIRKKVKELFPEIVKNGIQTRLKEIHVHEIKKNLAPRTLALKSEVENATTSLDIEEMTVKVLQYHMAEAERLRIENERQREQLAIEAPKVDFYNAVTGSKDTIDIGEAAKVMAIKGIGRNKLFELLRDKGILMQNNQPYQKYIDAGYFRTIESSYTTPDGMTHVNIKTVVYQRGLDYIRKMVTNG